MASKKPTKRYDKENAKVWGSPDYLKMRFDDIQEVSELSRKCKDTKEVKALVKAASTPADRLAVHRVYRAVTCIPGEQPASVVMADVSLGLNGGGSQSDYLAALKRLADGGGFFIFDCFIDAVDDLASVLCTYRPCDTRKPLPQKDCKSPCKSPCGGKKA